MLKIAPNHEGPRQANGELKRANRNGKDVHLAPESGAVLTGRPV